MLTQKAMSGSGQSQVDTVPIQDQPKSDTVSPQDLVKTMSGPGQGPVYSIRSGSGQGQVRYGASIAQSAEITLAPQQEKIYVWFQNNGFSGYFNKGQIARDTGISPNTIRKCLSKFVKLEIIKIFNYDPVTRFQKFELNSLIKVFLMHGAVSNIRSGPGQGQVDTTEASYKLVSKFYNKLTNYIENSELWKNQGLSIKKCEEWIKEFYPSDPEALLTQLMFAEKTDSVLNPKTKTSVDVFYGCLKKGGLTRPKIFEFPEEKKAKVAKESREAKLKALNELKNLQKKEQKEADELAFFEYLNEKESVELLISEVEKRNHITPRTRAAIKVYRTKTMIDSNLIKVLQREFKCIS